MFFGLVVRVIRKLAYGPKSDSESYIHYLRSLGMRIGQDVTIYVPTKTQIDLTRPWMIEIGNHVEITEGVTILTHGYDWCVLKTVYGDILGSCGKVKIGDNVFIGMHTTILKGINIGNNVIIGANSLVNKNIPDNCVVAGNPCRVIMSLDEYYRKRKEAQYDEAVELVHQYREQYGKDPDQKALHEFFWLFSDATDPLPAVWNGMMHLHENYEQSMKKLSDNPKMFNNMDDFLNKV